MSSASPTPPEQAELEALFALARREHHAGRLAEAAAACRRILALRPDLAEPHNNLGALHAQQGKFDQAAERFQQAVALKANYVEAHRNLGNVLLKQGKLDEAAARFERAIALKPDHFDAHTSLAKLLLSTGRLDQAALRFALALVARPDSAEAHNNLGEVLRRLGKAEEAAARFERAIALRPDYAEAYNNLGIVLALSGKHDQALVRFEQALVFKPDYAEAQNNLGNVLNEQGRRDQAAARYEQALALKPDYAEAHNNLGNLLAMQDEFEEAIAQFRQAILFDPGFAEAHNNLGSMLWKQGKFGEATACHRQALAIKPDFAWAYTNLGSALLEQGQLDDAAAHYQQALAIQPDHAEAEVGLALCYLASGDFERGWLPYEARLRMPGAPPTPNFPRWDGQPLAGRSLLLVAEQGLGDTLQFVRYARALKERGARVVLAAQATLGRLLASYPDPDELFILGSAAELPRCDFHLPLLSAPVALGTIAATIPHDVPYLRADPDLTDRWRQELAGLEGFKIGIVWQGSRGFRKDHWRSIPLAQFAPLTRVPGVQLISLQKGAGAEQVATAGFPLLDLSSRLDEAAGPFMDTAAVIRNLDLVITPDTAVAHLAGALGTPVWLALRLAADWRWLRDRADSPWYPTMRLFRQTVLGQWPDVFERMAAALQERRSETA